jgi:hypothetical protein
MRLDYLDQSLPLGLEARYLPVAFTGHLNVFVPCGITVQIISVQLLCRIPFQQVVVLLLLVLLLRLLLLTVVTILYLPDPELIPTITSSFRTYLNLPQFV